MRYSHHDPRVTTASVPNPINHNYYGHHSATPPRRQAPSYYQQQSPYSYLNSGSGSITNNWSHTGASSSMGASTSREHNPSSYGNGGSGTVINGYNYTTSAASSTAQNSRSSYLPGHTGYTQTDFASSAGVPRRSQEYGMMAPMRQQNDHEQTQSSDPNNYGHFGDTYGTYTQGNYDSLPPSAPTSRGLNLPPLDTSMLSQQSRSQYDRNRYGHSYSNQRSAESWNDRVYDHTMSQPSIPPILPSQTVSPPLSDGHSTSLGHPSHFSGTLG